MKCPLCGKDNSVTLTRRNNVPVIQNVIFRDAEASKKVSVKNISLEICRECDFVFNSEFDYVDYSVGYENNQTYSKVFSDYMENLAEKVVKKVEKLKGKIGVIEIGCGQGVFLKNIERKSRGGVHAFSMDLIQRIENVIVI